MNEALLDKELRKLVKPHLRLASVLEYLMNNEVINALLVKNNDNMIGRLGFTDHGRVHSKIVALNALKLLALLKTKPTMIKEDDYDLEDSMIAVLISAWLHDLGCGITREDHELIGVTRAKPIIDEILNKTYELPGKIAKVSTFIEEGILCHLGTYKATSIEAGIVSVADGTDITKGRARLSYMLGKRDIHDFSAMSIKSVEIKKGVEIHVKMNTAAGIFQVEETLLKKLRNTPLKDKIKVIVHIKGSKEKIKY